ncbi:tetratricopeptide repeat protein [Pedobacter sp. SYSU D00535]|uniref:tetratricopeptide repeat protein n=1 Tax=Pedobacter sp. SYSU D00535 TaxID=2810308 RepID=UPI001A95A429|nr:tetratricopeptide repeat protein [Pedobacter sp. SYSU D00535]
MKTLLAVLSIIILSFDSFAQSDAGSPRDINAFAQMYNEISSLMRQSRYREAINKTEQALKIDPKNTTLYTNLGTAYTALNELEKAEVAYKKAVSLNSDLFEANFNLAGMLMNKAIRKNNTLTRAGKSEKDFLQERQQIHRDADSAYPYIQKSIQLRPKDQQSLNLLKYYYILKEEPEKAAEVDRRLSGN